MQHLLQMHLLHLLHLMQHQQSKPTLYWLAVTGHENELMSTLLSD